MLADWLIGAAALVGLLAALAGDRAAAALCASLLASIALQASGFAFHPLVWAAIDVGVCAVLIRPAMPRRDMAIVLLFAPAWAAYFLPDPTSLWVVTAVVVAQFLLTGPAIPLRRWWRRARAMHQPARHLIDDFDLKVRT